MSNIHRHPRQKDGESRRDFLRRTFHAAAALAAAPLLSHCGGGGGGGSDGGSGDGGGDFDYGTVPQTSNFGNLGPLLEPDANGLRLPAGFTSRIIARSGQEVASTGYTWPGSPDGGATFPLPDGSYIYTANSELPLANMGGASAVRFDRDGRIRNSSRILEGTTMNSGGGPTPWGTWMSGEDIAAGRIHECDPHGEEPSVAWPMLGSFAHEAIAFDPATMQAYLTEDNAQGRFYRFTPAGMLPNGRPDLAAGTLEALRVVAGEQGAVVWETIADPTAATMPTRMQAPSSTEFNGGVGTWFFDGIVYFTTKGDNRLWALEVGQQELTVVYDAADVTSPILTGVDNITVTAGGDVLVCEDGGDMQLVVITPANLVAPIVQVMGHTGSEITGVALDPHRRRLYFSSQRGQPTDINNGGVTYEIEGPFFI